MNDTQPEAPGYKRIRIQPVIGAVYVPAKDAAGVTESGKPVAKAEGVTFLRMEHNAAVYEVGSGRYRFETALNK